MRIFGFNITRAKSPAVNLYADGVARSDTWHPTTIREPYTGAWQNNDNLTADRPCPISPCMPASPLSPPTLGSYAYAWWRRTTTAYGRKRPIRAYSPVLRKPNRYQTIHKFVEKWITSKLTAGNAYVLKQRDDRDVVTALYVLDPARVDPLLAPDGAVIYGLNRDDLTGVSNVESAAPSSYLRAKLFTIRW